MKIALKQKDGHAPARTARRPVTRARKSTTRASAPAAGFQLQKILVPVDFSACSARALDYATAFARPTNAEIILLYVVEPLDYPMYGQEITADYTALQTNLLDTGRERLAEFSRGKVSATGPIKLLVGEGSPWGEIVDAAKKEGVDLIIVSTHGHTGLRHVLLGSTAERVIRHAPCPVLIVREREREFVPVNQT